MSLTIKKRAAKSLPKAVADLVAEGGNVLVTDDKPVVTIKVTKAPSKSRARPNP